MRSRLRQIVSFDGTKYSYPKYRSYRLIFSFFILDESVFFVVFVSRIDRTEVNRINRAGRSKMENLRSSTAPLCVRSSTRSLNAGSTIRTKIPKFLQESVWNPPPIRSRIPPRCTFPCNFWSRIGSPGPTTVFYWCEINEFRHLELY